MRRSLSCVATALGLSLAGGVFAGDLQGMRLMEDDQGTRAVFELSSASPYKVFTLQNPERLVVDLAQTRMAPGFQLPAPSGAIANVRTGKPDVGVLRIVFDLGAGVSTSSRSELQAGITRLTVQLTPTSRQAKLPDQPDADVPPAVVSTQPAPSPVAASLAVAMRDGPLAGAPPEMASPSFASVLPAEVPAAVSSQPAPPVLPAPAPAPATRVSGKTLQDVIGPGQRKLVVAIDAGHGGKDPGALGPTGVREKVVTLAVARELARQINLDPGMRAVLIRDGDSFVPLQQRYMKARSAQADLFISIHADASPNHSASGASVYVLSTRGASSQAARWLADQENAADLVGGVSLGHKDHNLAAVLLDLSQSATMRASDDIATQVLGALKNVGKAHKPAIERANFVVLRSPDVPSMLIETGFITNPSEEKRLNDPGYRSRLAAAIADGVRRYFSDQPPPGSYYASRPDLRPSTRLHVVSRGETLSLIAARHGVGVENIRQANRRHGDEVRVGEALTIPVMASAPE